MEGEVPGRGCMMNRIDFLFAGRAVWESELASNKSMSDVQVQWFSIVVPHSCKWSCRDKLAPLPKILPFLPPTSFFQLQRQRIL